MVKYNSEMVILAELIMRNIELKVFSFLLTIAYPLLYLRYTDDILVAWQDTHEDFLALKDFLMTIYPTINLTWEKDNEREIAFLDLKITKFQDTRVYLVFHKFSGVPPLIPATAYQPQHYINAAIAPLIRRAFLSSSQAAIVTELNVILSAVNEAGYTNAKFMYISGQCYIHTLNKVKRSLFFATTLHLPKEPTIVLPALPFCGHVTICICRIFRRHVLFLPVSPWPNLRRLLANDRDPTSILERSGVYSIPLENMSGGCIQYIGATTRMLSYCILEHQCSIRAGKSETELARMVLQHQHTPLWSQVVILRHCNNRNLVYIWEALLINVLNLCNTPTLDFPLCGSLV
ncbi:uncharacterized protein LOC111627881 [Centruroides sculpturatus]|uniref:uncharacterized protein LOC111627881 n=1 Tax=Centruroides sculpturatus TaxID=218467 RepID=UPI000C6CCE2B|nr:uncharacterized protein LOC111627881 [Centruroides sculpturatus]